MLNNRHWSWHPIGSTGQRGGENAIIQHLRKALLSVLLWLTNIHFLAQWHLNQRARNITRLINESLWIICAWQLAHPRATCMRFTRGVSSSSRPSGSSSSRWRSYASLILSASAPTTHALYLHERNKKLMIGINQY